MFHPHNDRSRFTLFVLLAFFGALLIGCSPNDSDDASGAVDLDAKPGQQSDDPRRDIPNDVSLVDGSSDRASGRGPTFDLDDPTAPQNPELLGEPGRLIASQVVEARSDGTLHRIWYESSGTHDEAIMVSGLVAVPAGDGPEGGFPTISYAHEATGIGDDCAPSRINSLDSTGQRQWGVIKTPTVVVATDYEGLGTDGVHHLLLGVTEARSVLDATKAAMQLPDVEVSNRTIVWGEVQGGHAALFAGQLAETWAPELNVVGVVADSAATELPLLSVAAEAGAALDYLTMAAIGYADAYDLDLNDVATDATWSAFDEMTYGCTDDIRDAISGLSYTQLARKPISELTGWNDALVENNPGSVKFESPLLIAHGDENGLVPSVASDALATRLCGLGQVLEYRLFDKGGAMLNGEPAQEIGAWIDARFAGEAMPSEPSTSRSDAVKYEVCG
ncbi:MAG: hypothetical protein KDB86_11205 [Actinobacteria bacterium]|nr:hypothetical protein [Actinomycetota bacterium]